MARTGARFPLSTASSTVWTFHSAPVSGGQLARATLRTTVSDAAGGSIAETITSAYQTAS